MTTRRIPVVGYLAELSAAEIVRRAERCIGLAVRKGQAGGRITKPSRHAGSKGTSSPKPYFSDPKQRRDTYAVTDNVSDVRFEKGLSQAKAEGNLSRANVVRKLKGNGKANGPRWAKLANLAAAGHTSHQIAEKLGCHVETVRKKAAKCGVVIQADRVVGKSRLPKPDRILRKFVGALEALAPSCELIDISSLSPGVLDECVPVMVNSTKALRKLERRLKEAWDG